MNYFIPELELMQAKVKFKGNVISEGGRFPDLHKLGATRNLSVPICNIELRDWVGFAKILLRTSVDYQVSIANAEGQSAKQRQGGVLSGGAISI